MFLIVCYNLIQSRVASVFGKALPYPQKWVWEACRSLIRRVVARLVMAPITTILDGVSDSLAV